MTEFISTSPARRLVTRMQATHERRRISVFSGPPGIGKTTAIDEFSRRNGEGVAIVKVARRNAREVIVLQHTLEALRRLIDSSFEHAPGSVFELRRHLFLTTCSWAGVDPALARRGDFDSQRFPRLTIVFDEAQNLSREAIESLRYWNDRDRCYAPFPVGLVFVGNDEFSLAGASAAESVISAAVADRALYLQSFEYDDVADDDLKLFISSKGEFEDGAVAAIVRSFRGPRSPRSFRRLGDLLDDLIELADGADITVADVRGRLALA